MNDVYFLIAGGVILISIILIILLICWIYSLKKISSKEDRRRKKVRMLWFVGTIIVIISIVSLAFTIHNRIEYREWYALKKAFTQDYTGIKRVKLYINTRVPPTGAEINIYVSKTFPAEEAEAIFEDFLANVSKDFLEELWRHQEIDLMEHIMIRYMTNQGIVIYGFKTEDLIYYEEWKGMYSTNETFAGKKYYLEDYQ